MTQYRRIKITGASFLFMGDCAGANDAVHGLTASYGFVGFRDIVSLMRFDGFP